jgi:retinol dehydrogenase 8
MKQKIAVITGCSKRDGVGYNLAHELLSRGHRVIATARNLEKIDLRKEACPNPNNLDLKRLDLCDKDSIEKFIRQVLKEYAHIDVLVNNAADVVIGPVETSTPEDIQVTFQTKVFGPVALIQGFLPSMRERKQGLLIATSSIFCTRPFAPPGFPFYMAALCAFERIQEALAIELEPWNIKAVNFQAGPIKTRLTHHEGSKKQVGESLYKNFTDTAYKWYHDKTEWQDASEVAKVYAGIIEQEHPDFNYQSSQFGVNFVKQNRPDTSGNSYLEEYLQYFRDLKLEDPASWHIE